MFQSYKIATVFGIPLRAHASLVLLIPFLVLQSGSGLGSGFLMVVTLLVTVFLHELGHSLVARHFGLKVVDITFLPFGGLARMSEIPQDSKIEGWIAFAGPAVNFALAALAVPFLILLPDAGPVGWLSGAAAWFLLVNLIVGAFNLLPAFPMDGGRILRAFLGRDRDWLEATERTASVGRFFAIAFGLIGFLVVLPTLGCFFAALCLVFAAWIWWACVQEVFSVRMRRMRTAHDGASPFGGFQGAPFFGGRTEEREPEPHGGSGFTTADIEALENHRGRLSSFDRENEG